MAADAPKEMKDKDPLALVHSPHSDFGNLSFLFYFDGPSFASPHVFNHQEQQIEGKQECGMLFTYLNDKIPPHELKTISIYEDAHPQPEDAESTVNLTMIHNSGSEPQNLPERYGTAEGVSPDYRCKHFESSHLEDPWTESCKKAEKWINEQGVAEYGYAITAYNRSTDDNACVFVLYWNKANNDFYKQAERPVGCCSECVIF